MLKEEEEEQNNVVLSDTVPSSSSSGRAAGEDNAFVFSALLLPARGDHFRFGSVFTFKKQPNQKAKKKKGPKPNQNRSKQTGCGSVWVRVFRPKTGKTYGYFSGFVMGFEMGF